MPGTRTTRRQRVLSSLILALVVLTVPTGDLLAGAARLVAFHAATAGGRATRTTTSEAQRPVAAVAPAATPGSVPPSPTATPPGPAVPVTTRDTVVPDVGALFYADGAGDHFCTASVVDSPQRDLIITAAHCLHDGQGGDYRTGLAFVPGYHDGLRPYGTWTVTSERVDPRWAAGSDQDVDFGFATVAPLDGREIEDVVGANRLLINQVPGTVAVFGYPNGVEQPLGCVGPVKAQSTYQYRIDCPGYAAGTSGGPWLANYDALTHTGDVVGVIGGYQQGGYTDDISYTASFDATVRSLYDSDD